MTGTTDYGRRAILGGLAIAVPAVVARAVDAPHSDTSDTSEWHRAYAKWKALIVETEALYSEETPEAEQAWYDGIAREAKFENALMLMPVSSAATLVQKLEVVNRSYCGCVIEKHVFAATVADAKRVAAREA